MLVLILALVWLLAGSALLYFSLSARALVQECEEEILAGSVRSDFLPFVRRDFKQLPPLWVFVVRAFTIGPLSFLVVMIGLVSASISSIVLPATFLPWAMTYISYLILLGFGVHIKETGKRADLKEAPCIVANHTSAFDILVLLTKRVCFVSMEGVKDLYFIGRVAKALGCIFVSRDSKNSRFDAKQAIIERLTAQVNGSSKESNPLVVFPEGSTNNGLYLLEFRRGAFEPKAPIQPVRIEYSDFHANFTVVSTMELGALCLVLPGREVMIHWTPVITPKKEDTPEDIAARARRAIADVPSAYSHPPLILTDSSLSHRESIACADYMNEKVKSRTRKAKRD